MYYFFSFIYTIHIMATFVNVSNGHESESAKVLLISLDGFRQDYFDMAEARGINLKSFKEIFHKGIKADHINNLFLPRTLPNHMSIITGCYEETHGLIDNAFFDPLFNESFSMTNVSQNFQSKWFSAVEPIWVTNQKNGYQSAVIYWPGQVAPFRDTFFTSYSYGIYNGQVPFNTKIDVMLDWLKAKDTSLGILYHPHPDSEGHHYGPNSTEVMQALLDIDTSLGYLLTKIDESGLKTTLNVVIVSDHGMSDISGDKRVIMDDYLSPDSFYRGREESLTMWGLWPRDHTNLTLILANLSHLIHATVYERQQLPTEWHYAANRRVAPIIIVADEGWVLVHTGNDTVTDRGTHGYRLSRDTQQGLFVAWGPNIIGSNRSDIVVREIDVFPLIAEILRFEYRPQINGSLSRVRWMLTNRNDADDNVFSSLIMVCVLSLLCALAVCIVIGCAHYHAKSIHRQKVSQTYALQTGHLMRRRSNNNNNNNNNNNRKGFGWMKFNKNTKKKPKMAAADTAFLLESSSGNEDDILADVNTGASTFASS